jgi:hypothetical protein
MKRLRFSLRAKLGLVALVLLALPWAGALYVNEVERFLLEGQEQTLLSMARASPARSAAFRAYGSSTATCASSRAPAR